LLPIPKPKATFYDFEEYEWLVTTAQRSEPNAYLCVLLGGDAGLRCGEMMALTWTDVDLRKRQVCVQHSDLEGARDEYEFQRRLRRVRSPAIRASFFRVVHRFNWRSRDVVPGQVGCSSEYSSVTGLRVEVYAAAVPSLCSRNLRAMSLVAPT
jgi:integrase